MKTNTKLAIVCTHPIPYYTPYFKLLAKSTELKVFYSRGNEAAYDKRFRQTLKWDIPLLEGYTHEFLKNTSKLPGTHHFFGIINPGAIKAIQRYQPAYLLVYGWANYSHLQIMRYFKGKLSVLFRGDSHPLLSESWFRKLPKKIALSYIYKHIDLALTVGSNNKLYYKKYGLQDKQLIFCPHAVDNERFGNIASGDLVRKQLGIKPTDILILFTGKFIPLKNPGLLLQAFCQLKQPGTHLLLVGDGPLTTSLQLQYQRKDIHFLPFQNQSKMPAIYQACDLFCMPSKKESWGLALNEAMAAGKAVLASDATGAAADLITAANGMTFRQGDAADLLKKLRQLSINRHHLYKKGKASKILIASWSFKNQVKQTLHVIHQ